jgi:hypothetical protein
MAGVGQTRHRSCKLAVEIILNMDDQNNPNGKVGECPKRTFWLLPRPAIKPAYKGEDAKTFFRRMAQRAQMQNPNPGEAARA